MHDLGFDQWNSLKKEVNKKQLKEFYINKKQVWFIHKGKNIGYESNGKGVDFKRPVLVLKKVGCLYFCVSMSTKGKNTKFYYKLDQSYFGKKSFIVLSQVMIIDKRRFFDPIGEIKGEDFKYIQKKIQKLLF